MIRWTIIVIFPLAMLLGFSSYARAEQTPFEEVKAWLDANKLVYAVTGEKELALGFKGDNVARIDTIVGFSSEFIHLSAPVGPIPADAGADYYSKLIDITGSIPMVKPYIDKDRFFYLVIDFPLEGLSEDEVINDIALLVEFVDVHYKELYPWQKEK